MRISHLTLALSVSFLIAGCQSAKPLAQSGVEKVGFMSLWETYSHCQKSSDVEELIQDAVTLSKATYQGSLRQPTPIPLPGSLGQLVSTPSPRLAVDVKAMSAACSVRAGQAAATVEKFDRAREVLEPIFSYRPQSEYHYYALQARAILSKISLPNVQVSFNTP